MSRDWRKRLRSVFPDGLDGEPLEQMQEARQSDDPVMRAVGTVEKFVYEWTTWVTVFVPLSILVGVFHPDLVVTWRIRPDNSLLYGLSVTLTLTAGSWCFMSPD